MNYIKEYGAMWVMIFFVVAVTITAIVFITIHVINKNEYFVGYSGFKQTGRKCKNTCKNYFLDLYRQCIRNSGGTDFQGNCYNRIKPNLIACYYNDY